MCTAWPGCLTHQMWSSSCTVTVTASRKTSSSRPTSWSPLSTLLSSQTAATSLMLHLPRSTHTSATRCMGMSRTSTRTWLIWWPPASDTPAAPLPTVSAPSTASRSVASDIPNPCSPTQLLSQRKSQLSSQLETTG